MLKGPLWPFCILIKPIGLQWVEVIKFLHENVISISFYAHFDSISYGQDVPFSLMNNGLKVNTPTSREL